MNSVAGFNKLLIDTLDEVIQAYYNNGTVGIIIISLNSSLKIMWKLIFFKIPVHIC